MDLSAVEDNGATAQIEREFEIVSGDDLRPGKSAQDLEQLPTCPWIQIAGWFVEDEDRGITSKDTCQADSFSLAGT